MEDLSKTARGNKEQTSQRRGRSNAQNGVPCTPRPGYQPQAQPNHQLQGCNLQQVSIFKLDGLERWTSQPVRFIYLSRSLISSYFILFVSGFSRSLTAFQIRVDLSLFEHMKHCTRQLATLQASSGQSKTPLPVPAASSTTRQIV